MARINWNEAGTRYFETGVDRGVLFVGANKGVPWTGLISVEEEPTGGDPKSLYIDGLKYAQISENQEFSARITAFEAPREFLPCEGIVELYFGLKVTQQPKKTFDFSYRTQIGNDLEGKAFGYKIHLVYNALAGPSDDQHDTLSNDTNPLQRTWDIETVPPHIPGRRPTAHVILDTRICTPEFMSQIESILYGTSEQDPRLPDILEILNLLEPANLLGRGVE